MLAVGHPADSNLAVSSFGELFTYKKPNSILLATDNTGADQTSVLLQPDGAFYEGNSGTHVILDFGTIDTTYGARLLIRADPIDCRLCKLSIWIQIRDSAGVWQNRTLVVPRSFWYTEALNLSSFLPDPLGEFRLRLFFTTNHRVDYVALDTSKQQPVSVTEGSLVRATHSSRGDIATAIISSGNVFTDLLLGDKMESYIPNLHSQLWCTRVRVHIGRICRNLSEVTFTRKNPI